MSSAGRATLAGDLHLDCHLTLPAGLAAEMAQAATALLLLTRQPRPDEAWNDWCREFWERYGTGAVVPVTEAVHPDAGIGWPAGFPGSMLPGPETRVSRRDEELLRLACEALADGRREVVLTDDVIAAITADEPVDPRCMPPHVELGARVRAARPEALQAGDYTFTVHPAWSFGTLTSRFGPAVTRAGLDATYATPRRAPMAHSACNCRSHRCFRMRRTWHGYLPGCPTCCRWGSTATPRIRQFSGSMIWAS